MESTSQLVWGMLFAAVGFGYFLYGRKQKLAMPFLCGISLCVFPFFVSNIYLLVLIGVTLLALPYFIRL